MTTSPRATRAHRTRTPLWVVEGLDIARLRRVHLRVVAGVVCVVGIVLALVFPDLVPPTPLVGAAVGLAALLLGMAVAVAIDAADLTVRGPRHVRAAGGELVAILPTTADADRAMPLAEAVLEAREDGKRLLLGLAAAGRDARRSAAWTDALAVALARTGVSVLRVDLASGRSERPGLVEVVREGEKLPTVVSFEPDLRLARLGAGRDHAGALEVLPTLPTRLPRDLDVLLVSLPTAASRQVVAATRALDHVLVIAERDTTSRVDLIAGLDAMEAAGIAAQVTLLDDRTAARLTSSVAERVSEEAPAEDDPATEVVVAEDDGAAPTAGPAADEPTAPVPAAPVAREPTRSLEVGDDAAGPLAETAVSAPAPVPAPEVEPGPAREPARPAAVTPDSGIRLLEGAEASRPPSPDLQQPSVAARDVDLITGAAAARAASRAEAEAEADPPFTPVTRERGEASATSEAPISAPTPEPTAAEPASSAEEPELAAAPASEPAEPAEPAEPVADAEHTTRIELPEPVDVTDELPRIDGRHRASRGAGEDSERDDLRTTAQLAVLLDDLQARGERP